MSNKLKLLVGVGATLLIVLIAAGLFFRHLITKSFPQTTGSLQLSCLSRPVSVYRDGLGIPHILAENEDDAYAALGFVHAQDRLWQMELSRRIGQGRLSELFGVATIPFDRMLRTIGFQRIAGELARNLRPPERRALESYVKGVNAYIELNRGRYPIEFDMLRIEPEPWTIENTVVISRLMAWELNMSWWFKIEIGDIVDRFGEEKAKAIFPSYPASAPVIVGSAAPAGEFRKTALAFRRLFGIDGSSMGSNSWAVSGSRTVSGKPLLANDPHLAITNPSKWYQVSIRGGALAVEGVSIPGVPGIVIGRNTNIAWGLTNVMADDADFFIEKIDSTSGKNYLVDGAWRPVTIREEEIAVRDSTSVTIQIRSTHHGPIISDVHADGNPEIGEYPTRLEKTGVVSMCWTGSRTDSDELGAFYGINHATTWEEFRNSIRLFTVPGQNFVYADTRGNIGFQAGVRIPIRGAKSPFLPQPGWISANDWRGFVPFDALPSSFNPPGGVVATANNKTMGDSYPYYISNMWEPPSRIERITELLAAQKIFSSDDFKRIQSDDYSPLAHQLVPYILRAFDSASVTDKPVRAALDYFRNWNYRFAAGDNVTSIYNSWLVHLARNALADELGDEGYHNYVFISNVPLRVIPQLLRDSTSSWFDDVRTPQVETRDDIIRKSLTDALAELQGRFGNEMKTWQWGEMHQIRMRHVFGEKKPLDLVFDLGPYPLGGASTTIISGEYNIDRPYDALVASSMRQIVDLSDSTSMQSIITSGESGQPFSAHFKDQVPLWLNQGYHTITLDAETVKNSGWEHLTLVP